jgi:hypothetical protein
VRGSRRRVLALAASVLAAAALAVAAAGRGCGVDTGSPQGAVRAFLAAASAGDREGLYELLGPETRDRLDLAARRATDLVAGARRYQPVDMISVATGSEVAPTKEVNVVSRSEGRAVVEVVDAGGQRAALTVVRVDGSWYIELSDQD